MIAKKLLEEINARVSEVIATSPAKDIEKNVKATLTALLGRMDLVTREEFDVQAQVLARTRAKLQELEGRLSRLEDTGAGAPEEIVQHGDASHLEP